MGRSLFRRAAVVIGRDAALVAAGLFVIYIGLCLFMFLRQDSYVFFPDARIWATPGEEGLAYEDVRPVTADGVSLGAWWIPCERARGSMIFAHGNGGNIGDRVEKAAFFHRLGLSILLFDYRGYGSSGGEVSEEGTYDDMAACAAWVQDRGGGSVTPVLYYGESLGGAVVVQAALERPPDGLILDSTFTSIVDMAKRHYPWLPARWIARIHYDSLARIPSVTCPVLVMHSPEDDIVPFEMGEHLFAAAPEPKRFAAMEGDHNSGGITESPGAQRELEAFLDDVLGPIAENPEQP